MYYEFYIAEIGTDINENDFGYNKFVISGDYSNKIRESNYQPHAGDYIIIRDYNIVNVSGIIKKVIYDFSSNNTISVKVFISTE